MRLPWMLAGVMGLFVAPQIGVNALIQQLESSDSQAVSAASAMLKERGLEVMPALLKTLKDDPNCQLQFVLSNVVRDLQPDSPVPNATLVSIAESKCKQRPPADAMFRRQAAFFLASRADAVSDAVAMLQSSDSAHRRTAVLAFVDVMKGLATGVPKIELTPELAKATMGSIAALGKALTDSDQYVRCASFDALTAAGKIPAADDLKNAAVKVLDGVPAPKCPTK